MYKIAVVGDYDSIYGFATLGLGICPVKTREETVMTLHRLVEEQYGIIYITEAAAAMAEDELEEYREKTPARDHSDPRCIGEHGSGC